jgi:hypothetical protein
VNYTLLKVEWFDVFSVCPRGYNGCEVLATAGTKLIVALIADNEFIILEK